jgi:hypothetical protein
MVDPHPGHLEKTVFREKKTEFSTNFTEKFEKKITKNHPLSSANYSFFLYMSHRRMSHSKLGLIRKNNIRKRKTASDSS